MMKQLSQPLFSRYRQGETLQYLKNLFDIFPETKADELDVLSEWQELNAAYQELFAKWQPERGSRLTAVLAALDKERGSVFVAFKKTVDAWAAGHFDPGIKAAARVVSHNIASHGKRIYNMNYEQESATLDAIINDCEGVHAHHIAAMGLGSWVAALKSANETFGLKYVERLEDYFTVEPGIVAQLIETGIEKHNSLKVAFEVRGMVAGLDNSPLAPSYEEIAHLWEVLMGEFNDIARRRYYDRGNAEEPMNPDEPEDYLPPEQNPFSET